MRKKFCNTPALRHSRYQTPRSFWALGQLRNERPGNFWSFSVIVLVKQKTFPVGWAVVYSFLVIYVALLVRARPLD